MRLKAIIIISALMGWIILSISPLYGMKDFVETIDTRSRINWTTGSLSASGSQEVGKKIDGKIIDYQPALMAAKLAAHNNLLKTAKAVRITGARTVGDYAGNDENVMAKLMDLIKTAPVAGQAYSTNGKVDVFLSMSTYGGFLQLVLPDEIKHVESIRTLNNSKDATDDISGAGTGLEEQPDKEIYSGLVVDARGLGFIPVLSPRIMDEARQEIYGPTFVSREIAVQKGICIYEGDMAAAKAHNRVLANPLVVKAIRTHPQDASSLVISKTEALKIKSASEHLAFLKQCRVIIVVDVRK